MPEPEKSEQPEKLVHAKTWEKEVIEGNKEYFWAGSVFTMTNSRRENIHGVVEAANATIALEMINNRYSVARLYRYFELATLNRV